MANKYVSALLNAVQRKRAASEQKKSVDWLKAKLDNFAVYGSAGDQEKEMKKHRKVAEPLTGQMVMFMYSAKHKDTLPFWDAAPLVIFMGPVPNKPNHFYGMNLHYLPNVLRAKFFDALLDTLDTKKVSKSSRLIVTYDLLKSAQKYKYFKPAWKQYIAGNVKSRIVLIPPEEWVRVLFLNSAEWQNAGSKTVYDWSRNIIG